MSEIAEVSLQRGDCLEVLLTLPPASVDLILSDLPYGTTRNAWDTVIPFADLWAAIRRVSKPRTVVVLTAQAPFDKMLAASNIREFRYEWIWEKPRATGHLNVKRQPLRAHEHVLVFSRRPGTYHPQKTPGVPYRASGSASKMDNYGAFGTHREGSPDGTRYPRSVLRFKHEMEPVHPTQKPVELMAYMIRTYSNPGEVVLDCCMGSGTTGVACLQEGRAFVGIERDPRYFDIAKSRLDAVRSAVSPQPRLAIAA